MQSNKIIQLTQFIVILSLCWTYSFSLLFLTYI